MMHSAIYCGSVMHRRLRPKKHYLRYGVFYLLLDLDELSDLNVRLLGVERRFLFSFHAADHGDGGSDLKGWVLAQLRGAGISDDVSNVRLLCFPRVLGFVFNPISVYFCSDSSGDIVAIVYEVNNTFGGRHAYVLPAKSSNGRVFHSIAKRLYVSPFNDVSGGYNFAVRLPADKVALSIDQHDGDGPILKAAFAGRRYPLDNLNLLRVAVLYPLLTLKVVAAIHWEALKLWMKGVPLHKRPQFRQY